MRYHAIAMILLMIGAALAGCTADDTSTDDGGDTGGDTGGTTNQTTNDTAGNETTDGGNGTADGGNGTAGNGNGTTNNTVQYVGFLDNTTVSGYGMSTSGNFSSLALMDAQNCTNPQEDALPGVIENDFCIIDYAVVITSQSGEWDNVTVLYNETYECVIYYVNDTAEGCLELFENMSISGRVMWTEYLDHKEGPEGAITTSNCLVYIESPAFVPSSQYNRIHNSSSSGVNWDELWADPAYVLWEDERMSAYSVEEANAPSWCTSPQFDALYWMTSPADN